MPKCIHLLLKWIQEFQFQFLLLFLQFCYNFLPPSVPRWSNEELLEYGWEALIFCFFYSIVLFQLAPFDDGSWTLICFVCLLSQCPNVMGNSQKKAFCILENSARNIVLLCPNGKDIGFILVFCWLIFYSSSVSSKFDL